MAFQVSVFTVPSMVTAASITSAISLNGNFVYVSLEVPTMSAYSTATPIYIQVSADGTNFRRFVNTETNTSTVGANDFQIVSAVSNRMVNIPNFGFPYAKVEVSATVSGTVVPAPFKFICVSNQ